MVENPEGKYLYIASYCHLGWNGNVQQHKARPKSQHVHACVCVCVRVCTSINLKVSFLTSLPKIRHRSTIVGERSLMDGIQWSLESCISVYVC